jgi:uncharacterized protein YndB with AHSA1/START domain
MAPLVSTIEVARPPEEVFAVVTDPLRFGEWQPDVARVQLLGDNRFATTRRMRGGARTLVQEITTNDRPTSWAVEAVDGPIRPRATVTIEPVDGGAGSRVTFTLDFEGHGIGVPLIPLIRRQAQKTAPTSYQNLKKLLEDPRQR